MIPAFFVLEPYRLCVSYSFKNPVSYRYKEAMIMNNQFYPYNRTQNNITWVQGIEGAKAYQMIPNSNTVLMDSENDGVFYIKVSDNVGMCNLRKFEYKEVNTSPDMTQYVTREELLEAIKELKNEQFVSTNKSKSNKQQFSTNQANVGTNENSK